MPENSCRNGPRDTFTACLDVPVRELAGVGAEAVILGCTEIELLISGDDSPLPAYPSTTIHAHAAVDFALGN